MEPFTIYHKNWYGMSNHAIVKSLAAEIKKMRLNKNLTQSALAQLTGIDRITISRFENGRTATLLTVVQILRALEKLEVFNSFQQQDEISPMAIIEDQEKKRKRASNSKPKEKNKSEW